jgi:cytochrome bd-type quinol oxidase subunit 2
MLVIVLIGMSIVLVCSVLVHRVFKGKVTLDGDSY